MARTKNQTDSMKQTAAQYRDIMLKIKELEKQAAPLKKILGDYAKSVNLISLNLGAVTLERRSTQKFLFRRDAITPDWLWRMQRDGCFDGVKIGIDPDKLPDTPEAGAYMAEIGLETKESFTYALRLNNEQSVAPAP